MKKMFRLLEDVNSFNSFCEVEKFEHVNGNQEDIYFRLVQKKSTDCEECNSLRYLPAAGSTITVEFDNIDQASVVSRAATQAYPNDDRSVWKVTVLAGEKISGAMKIMLTEGGQTSTLLLDGRLVASGTDSERFFC